MNRSPWRLTPAELIVVLSMSMTGLVWGADQLAMPLYLNALRLNSFEVGAIISGMMLVGSFLGLLFSSVADAYRRKPVAIAGRLVAASAFVALYMRIPYAALMVMGLGGGSLSALLSEVASDLDRDMSLVTSISTAMAAVGALVPGLLGLRNTMAVNAFVMASTAIILVPVPERYRGSGKISLRLRSIGNVTKLSTQAFIGLGAGLILPMMSLWFFLRFHVSAQYMSPFYMASNVLLAAGTLMAPVLGRILGRVKAIVFTHGIGIALLIALPFAPGFYEAATIFVLRNLAMNIAGPLFSSLVLNLIPSDERARGMSLVNLIDAVPRSFGPSMTGYLFSVDLLDLPFFVTAMLYTAATAAFYWLFKDVDRGQGPTH